jgi:hypothetical protein
MVHVVGSLAYGGLNCRALLMQLSLGATECRLPTDQRTSSMTGPDHASWLMAREAQLSHVCCECT